MADYPDNLKFSVWEKKKDSIPKGHEVGDKLKSLQKKHDALNWKGFDAATWARPCKKVAELEQAFAQADRQYRAQAFALKKDANDLATAAGKMGKEKGAAKPVTDAAKAIGVAVNVYAGAIDDGAEELKKAFETFRLTLLEESEKDDKPEPPAALLDKKKLLSVLQLCKREPARRVQFAFVDGKDKQPPELAMHPKQTGRTMFASLQEATGVKAGAYGTGWVDNTTLFLQVEKTFSGLTKKVRLPLKTAGFRVSKVVLVKDDGSVLEQDEDLQALAEAVEGGTDSSPPPQPTDPVEPVPAVQGRDAEGFKTRLGVLLGKLPAALAKPQGAGAKLKISEAGVFAKKSDWAAGHAALDEAERLLGQASGGTQPQAPAQPKPVLASSVVYKQSQLVWSQTRDKVRVELQRLEAAILDVYAGDDVLPKVTQAVRKLDTVLEKFDAALVDKIDQINAATSDDERGPLHNEARDIIKRYQGFLAGDPLVLKIDKNPFTRVGVEASLKKSLEMLASKIA